jgi:hypothetical protein
MACRSSLWLQVGCRLRLHNHLKTRNKRLKAVWGHKKGEILQSYIFHKSQGIPSSTTPESISTHDASRTKYHLHELSTITARLDHVNQGLAQFITYGMSTHSLIHAAASIFPNKGRSRYQNDHVLLPRWEQHSMGVQYKLADLAKMFEAEYGYATETSFLFL